MDSVTGPLTNPYEKISRPARRRLTAGLLELARGAQGEARQHVLDHVVVVNMCVARSIASRYASRGIPQEDLEQVAYAALVRSVQNFDLESGRNLLTYLVPSIRGELRRHFRDLGWTVRPPRRVQELQSRVVQERDNLPASATETDATRVIADRLDVSQDEVREALAAQGCFSPTSLDATLVDGGGEVRGGVIPCPHADRDREAAEARAVLAPAIRRLSPRDQELVRLRFFEDLSQQEIADEFGVTQAQVSRLLRHVVEELRTAVSEPVPA